MSNFTDTFPSRIEEDILIYNMSLPLPPVSENTFELSQENADKQEDYEPAFGELLKSVECPICRCIPTAPIYNCENGHITCNSCLPRLPSIKCGYCMGKFTKIRNYPLENMISVKIFKCDFWNSGCRMRGLTMAQYENHVKSCSFSPITFKTPSLDRVLTAKNQNPILPYEDSFQPCPKCSYLNSKRKLKCQHCHLNLRIPTPMCSRHVLGSMEHGGS